jgi:hypothetical protein
MILSTKIKNYYYKNLSELPADKQFHFATRIAAWNGEEKALNILKDLKPTIVSDDDFSSTFRLIVNTPQSGRRNAHELRQPFFEKYPLLYGVHSAVFRLRHLQSVYDISAQKEFFSVIPKEELDALYEALQNDPAALRVLSTFAVNFMYLYKKIALNQGDSIRPEVFLGAACGYDTSDITDMQLKIYLYTHCIIGDSNFYTEEVPSGNIPTYNKMLMELESLIVDNFDAINLDNKLEFLVCARIINFKSTLFEKIDEECQKSISPNGTFVIDVHNKNLQQDKTSFDKSEHRNVLYIMSASPYTPHSTIVG